MKFDNFMVNERNLAKELASKFSPDDPTFAKDLMAILINAAFGDEIDFKSLFGEDGASEITKAFGLGDNEPLTVTKTTTSVGGLPGDMGAAPEEAEAIANNMLGEEPIDLKDTDEGTNFADALASAMSDEEVRNLCAKYGIQLDPDDSVTAPEDSDPASDANLDKLDNKKPEEKKPEPETKKPEEKPEEKKPEPEPEAKKPEEKPEEKKPEAPKEDKKDEPDDTMKNITSALSNRI